jgi:regulator of sigma E protease
MSLAPLLHGGLYNFLWVVFSFLIVLTPLVFVHELGHYLLARRNGVRVDIFSIGFGRELFGWTDRAGTRWKFSLIPLGGYVKMFGDSDASSGLPTAGLARLSAAEREVSFHYKRLGQRAAIVAGGPAANFIFAIVVLAVLFMTRGQPFTPPEVGRVTPGSAAEMAGFKPGDVIVSIDGHGIDRFEDVQQAVRLNGAGAPMQVVVRRGGETLPLQVSPSPLLGVGRDAPTVSEVEPGSTADQTGLKQGDRIKSIAGQPIESADDIARVLRSLTPGTPVDIVVERGAASVTLHAKTPPLVLGIGHSGIEYIKRDPAAATVHAVTETWKLSAMTLQALWQIVTGTRSPEELGGPVKIAQLSGEFAQGGIVNLLAFMAMLSINLGLINLFPVPVLDGGHLLFYAAEAVRGKPLGQRAQEYGFRIGLALVVTLMLYVTWNDVHIKLMELVRGLVT